MAAENKYIGGVQINIKQYMKEQSQKKEIKKRVLELLKLKSEVKGKAQELSKLQSEYFGLPYKKLKTQNVGVAKSNSEHLRVSKKLREE